MNHYLWDIAVVVALGAIIRMGLIILAEWLRKR